MSTFEFHPLTTDYNAVNAIALARAARLAYSPAVLSSLSEWGFSGSRALFLDRKGTQCYIAGDEELVLMAFAGTRILDLRDLKTKKRINLVPGPRGEIHHGFRDALSHVWEDLISKLRELRHQGQPVWVTGHSAGAALSTVAVAKLNFEMGLRPQGLYTFGSPRVGDEGFASAFDEALGRHTFRFRNNNDVVTKVPVPGVLFLRYRHVGTLRYFDAEGRLHTDVGAMQTMMQTMWDRIAGGLDDLGKPGSSGLKDHAIDRYVELLERNV